MAVKTSALSSTVRPFRARATRGAATPRGRLRLPKNFLSVLDFDADGFAHLLELAARLKRERKLGRRAPTAQALAGQHVALLFEKPSLRTRATFEIAVRELGGDVIVPPQDGPLGGRETVADVARNLERWVSCVVIRTFGQDRARRARRGRAAAARHQRAHQRGASVPGARRHADAARALGRTRPRRARADHRLRRRRQQRRDVAGAGGDDLGVHVRVATPKGYELSADVSRHAPSARRSTARRSPRSRTRSRRSAASTPSTPTSGRRWARRTKPRRGCRASGPTR